MAPKSLAPNRGDGGAIAALRRTTGAFDPKQTVWHHYGYARVSTLDQDLGIQHAALKAAGCKVVRAEKVNGSRRDGRAELQVVLDCVQHGDTLVVTRIVNQIPHL